MKRFISLLLAGLLLTSVVGYAKTADDYVLSESFCGLVTNSGQTGNITAQADGVHVIALENNDKALQLEAGRRRSISAEADISGAQSEFVFSMDIEGSGCLDAGELLFYDGGGAAWKVVEFSGYNIIKLCDGKQVSNKNIKKMTQIDVVFDLTASVCSVYINGQCSVYGWYISGMPKKLSKAELKYSATKEGSAAVTIGGMWAYNGDKPKVHSALPKGNYNLEEVEYVPTEFNTAVIGSNTYYSRTYDEPGMEPFIGTVLDLGTNTIEKVTDKKTQNSYIRFVKNYTGSSIMDVRQSFSEHFVIEFDMSMGDNMFSGSLYLRGTQDNQYLLYFAADGTVSLATGEKVCTLQKGKWIHCAVVVDLTTTLIDVYVNNELLYKEAEMPVSIPSTSIVRLYIGAGGTGSGGELFIDNYKIYDGTEPRNESEIEENRSDVIMNDTNTLLSSEAEEKKLLSNCTAIAADGAYIAKGDEKIKLSASAYKDGKNFMVPLRAMAEAYGYETGYDYESKKVTVANVSIKDGVIYYQDKPAEVKTAPVIRDGVSYISAEDFAKYIAQSNVDIYDHGAAIFSDSKTSYNADEERKVWAYLFYERPSAEKILADFTENVRKEHPRVIVDQEQVDRIKRLYKNNDKYAVKMYNAIVESANRYAKLKPTTWADYSTYKTLYVAREIRDRFYNLGFAYLMTGNKDYVQPVWEQIQVAAGFSEWGEIERFLGCGEMLGAFAVAYDWMYDCWSEEQRAFIEEAILKKGLQYSYQAYRGTLPSSNPTNLKWYSMEGNWNQVCNGGTAMAACAVIDIYPKECSLVLSDALRSNEFGLEAFYPLGSYSEGMGYQAYALRYLTTMYSTVKATLGTDYGMIKAPGLSNTFNFCFDLSGPSLITNNYHDSAETSSENAYLWWFADKYDNKNYYDERVFQMENYVSVPSVYDAVFYNPEHVYSQSTQTTLPLDAYYPGEELVSLRGEWKNPNSAWISYHGGTNNMSMHGHIDTGTFILEMLGERWAKDLGSDTYSSSYWTETGRPTYYRIRAEGHNTLVLNPDGSGGQITGEQSWSPVTRFESKAKGAISVIDMTNAYSDNAQSVQRGIMLCDDRRNVLMRDEMKLGAETDVYWFMHTDAKIEIIDANTAILTKNGARLKCVMSSNLTSASFSILDASPLPTSPKNSANSENKGIQRLTIKGTGKGYAYIQVKFMDEFAPEANDKLPTQGIGEWTIPDGELVKLPVIDNIMFNGKAISGFNPNNKNYSVYIPSDTDISSIPVKAVCGGGIESDISYNGNILTVKAYRTGTPKLASIYSINCVALPKRADIEGYVQCPLANVERSDAQEGYDAYNAVDGDTTTRWAANGSQWLIMELTQDTKLDAVALYMMNSATRTSQVKIEVSTDKNTWDTVFEGTIGGVKDGYDILDTGGKNAKFVKLTANGNSVNSWNSVMEFSALKKK
ncbi:MAG: discoidin domain-containing protein [Clostridia bacterium]|nr:discoidin domain-containing protein [Clostridia bacterium]